MPKKRSSPIVTLKTVAQAARVTPAVVSAVLGGKTGSIRYSPETAERVREAAQKLQYRPHRTAQHLRTRGHQAIGLISTHLFNLPHLFLHWLSITLGRRDQLLIIQNISADNDPRESAIFRQRVVDAAICCEAMPATVLDCITDTPLPTLFVNVDPPCAGPRLLFDEAGAMALAVSHLRDQGYRHVVLFHDDTADGYWTKARRSGLVAACMQAGLPAPQVVDTGSVGALVTTRFGLLGHAVEQCVPGMGILLQDGRLLQHLVSRLAARGLEVPRDIGVIAIGLTPSELRATQLELNTKTLAEAATEVLLDPIRITKDHTAFASYELLPGATTQR